MVDIEIGDMRVPALGLGTWQLKGAVCRGAVNTALGLGYRHFDTAAAYGNEEAVGDALTHSSLPRSSFWVTSKVWYEDLKPEDLLRSAKQSLERLDMSYVDLLLVHWPNPAVPLKATMQAMEQAVYDGLTKHIGVSNFPAPLLKQALEYAPLSCIQVECHPYLQQLPLRQLARERRLMFTAYSPLARGRVHQDPTLQAIGEKYGKTPSQVALRWLVQHRNVAAIPKATGEAHLRENIEIFDFALELDELEQISTLNRDQRLIDPAFAPAWD